MNDEANNQRGGGHNEGICNKPGAKSPMEKALNDQI